MSEKIITSCNTCPALAVCNYRFGHLNCNDARIKIQNYNKSKEGGPQMKVPAKGKAVLTSYDKQSTSVMFSTGKVIDGKLEVSLYSDCNGGIDTIDNWQEVEITPVVHVPEDMKLCKVWHHQQPEIPIFRLSTGRLDGDKHLLCYPEGSEKPFTLSPWKHWEEVV